MSAAELERKLIDRIETLEAKDEDNYILVHEVGGTGYEIKSVREESALIALKYPASVISEFFPLTQLRELEGEIYVSTWILDRKGLAY